MEIAIALDSYDDLFSPFDIRDYGERALSRDFLDELHVRHRRTRARPGRDIVFLLPAEERNEKHEELIKTRIFSFFEERHQHYLKEDKKAKLTSALFLSIGLALSVSANLIVERFAFLPLFNDFVLIPSWFFVWTGFDILITNRKEISRKKRYYSSLLTSRAVFKNIENYLGRP